MKKIVVVILLLAAVGGGAYFLGRNGLTVSFNKSQSTATPMELSTSSPSPSASPKATDASANESDLIAAVKAGLVAEHGPDAASMDITVSTVEGNFAKGMANSTGGGGIWFAAKAGDNWKLVWDGNGIIFCSDLANYSNFPKDLIPQCWDQVTNKLITR